MELSITEEAELCEQVESVPIADRELVEGCDTSGASLRGVSNRVANGG
jgi:hypothetical protein